MWGVVVGGRFGEGEVRRWERGRIPVSQSVSRKYFITYVIDLRSTMWFVVFKMTLGVGVSIG